MTGRTTHIGVLRDRYEVEIESAPPRWLPNGDGGYQFNPAYLEWASRADVWAAQQEQEQ